MNNLSIAIEASKSGLAYAEAHGVQKIVEVRMTIGELTCVEPD